eukprot:CAMPEP_0174286706 /NCGR_PEP_ID=MMETSP0809-20121228/12768_1 /TAXON_ID=73025 ORGANISM="Eutreptiella gymnastica-like, Strain CCMP1594" /NCGR_SAMPLE_ID=MMETSP0809 /ASSEMBLY_ACC=CAM_ASM_000658 /LENGTH=77 /DNA_ID=CAMNT_0015382879 /DNA_START=715 /DNA_END=948 /DNA_ORIENTATION=-
MSPEGDRPAVMHTDPEVPEEVSHGDGQHQLGVGVIAIGIIADLRWKQKETRDQCGRDQAMDIGNTADKEFRSVVGLF